MQANLCTRLDPTSLTTATTWQQHHQQRNFWKATANSPTALLDVNETYASLKRRAKNSLYSKLITSIRELEDDTIHTSTAELYRFSRNTTATFSPTRPGKVNKALKQQLASNPDSSPGKDGISYRFIDRAFSSFGPLLVEVYNNLFHAAELPETMKPVLFKFLLKEGKDKNKVTSYRPIALISTMTRLFSKILVNRLQPIFQSIISEDQQGFIQQLQQLVDKMNQDPLDFHLHATKYY
ncbi:unnamed protein product [Ambrosiozyma monospora]|uniref:Unnamed protein product n=1 Tax=Ambrosiozyma monospora TaxID=43982 RepID=A0ACB5T4A9_AMBMO|nr:unnamed protein product [Ambrosiozyma monospora]